MRVLTLFDESGKVLAMFHPSPKLKEQENVPVVAFRPGQGQYAKELEVPQHLEKIKPKDLHQAVRVEIQGETYRLIAHY